MSLHDDIESLVKSLGLELYDISVVNDNDDTIYRVSVVSGEMEEGKRKGVALDRCVDLTHLISPLLDVNPPLSGDYRLEVGTPGIERKITSVKQYVLSIGEKVALSLKNKEKLEGLLKDVQDSKLFLEIDGVDRVIDFGEVSKAKTYFEW
ncbi:MAG: ribosome maturation factor RimP [Campylobacterota bacterium]|nr:ribosome maturation factor RimP [Campylobacterota bacterium]